MLERVLVANRGEIARRIIRTCRRLDVGVVAVHSDADGHEPHVHEADRAVRLGPAPATASYLDVRAVVDAAVTTGCDAVHPGYGFLAENAELAEAVTAAGLIFVGPPAHVIRLLGDKAAAKRHLAGAGVPVIPGDDSGDLNDADLLRAGRDIGAPLVVKAVAGGGGKGMRTVEDLAGLPDALAAARRESQAAFGDDRLILERLVSEPRHVEVQVLGDRHGTIVHLGERECSIQRRHQKLVEEAPSPALDDALRARMTAAAVTAARAVSYESAGTVEFLVAGDTLDHDDPEFAFLEVNTRLQVEHPVTEFVTGLDLVEQQLRVAAGEPLGFDQEQVRSDGHAIEVRLYAEDPVHHLPQTGTVEHLVWPGGAGIRVDSGIEPGSSVTTYYDPLLAKLIVHAGDRSAACQRLADLLAGSVVQGVTTNLALLRAVVGHPRFRSGDLTTGFLTDHLGGWEPAPPDEVAWLTAASTLRYRGTGEERTVGAGGATTPWSTLGPHRPTGSGGWLVGLETSSAAATVVVRADDEADEITIDDGAPHRVAWADATGPPLRTPHTGRLVVGDQDHDVDVTVSGDGSAPMTVWVHAGGRTHAIQVAPIARPAPPVLPAGAVSFAAPMPGAVLAVDVGVGDHVTAGTTLAVVEAMKMEHPVVAPVSGQVTAVHVRPGDAVEAGTTLLEFEAHDPPTEARPTVAAVDL